MKKINLICINYNSDKDTRHYLQTIENDYLQNQNQLLLKVIVVDNSTIREKETFKKDLKTYSFNIEYIKNENNGYFGAAQVGLNYINKNNLDSDFTIVSNVDLSIQKDFFKNLISKQYNSNIGVIAPSILSNYRESDLNPKILKKAHKIKFMIFKIIFSSDILFNIQNKMNTKKYRKKKHYDNSRFHMKNIYAAHGAFIIFTKEYFEKGGDFKYPIFLFGEEIYVAESCKKFDIKILYDKDLRIIDNDHGSTGKEKIAFIRREHKKAIKFILDNYYD